MKTLTGTEKQIKWAKSIRESFIKNFNEEYEDDSFEDFGNEKSKKVFRFILENADSQDWINNTQSSTYCLDIYSIMNCGKFSLDNIEYKVSEI